MNSVSRERRQCRQQRDRSAREKRERIFRVTSELFAEGELAIVTTQEIPDRADVAAGALFLYAASKRQCADAADGVVNTTAALLVPTVEGADNGTDLLSGLRLQIEHIVAGFLATASRQRHDLLGAGHSAGEQGKLT